MTRSVPDHRLGIGARSPSGDHDEAPHRKLSRVEPEDESLRRHVDLDLRGLVDAAHGAHARLELLRQVGAREVGDVALEDAEVGAADVDQVTRGAMHPLCDREERDDQRDAERDAGRREERACRPAEEVLADEAEPGHRDILPSRGMKA